MSPTVFRHKGYRFYFFSREEARMHVHASASKGEGKFWIEPEVELAMNAGLTKRDIANIIEIIREKKYEIVDSWKKHFKA
jgi:hypothetical protein